MIIKIDVPEVDTMKIIEVAEQIAKAQGWTCETNTDRTVLMKTPEGRVGEYDVLTDELIWRDDPDCTYYMFDGDDNEKFNLSGSLAEFLDFPTAIWGLDEDDNWVLYTE